MKKTAYIFLVIFLASCGGPLTTKELVKYVEGKSYPYRITKTVKNVEFTMIYTPNSYLTVKGLGATEGIQKEAYEKRLADLDGFMHFTFSITEQGTREMVSSGESTDMQTNLSYLVNDIQFDIKMKAGDKEQECLFANYERNYNLGNVNNFTLVFERPAATKNIKLVYNDRYFNIGPVVFDFKDIKDKKIKL